MTCQVTLMHTNGVMTRQFESLRDGLTAHYELRDAGAISVLSYHRDGELRFPRVAPRVMS